MDTHSLVWWSTEPHRLDQTTLRLIGEAPTLGVSAITFWEVSLLVRKGRLRLSQGVQSWASTIVRVPRIRTISLTPEIALAADHLAMHPDPADRFIVATALSEGCPLLTKDRLLHDLDFVNSVW